MNFIGKNFKKFIALNFNNCIHKENALVLFPQDFLSIIIMLVPLSVCVILSSGLQYFVPHSGADVTARDNDEMMPLMLAIQAGKMEIISVLLDLGIDIHAEAKNDKSIIIWAIEKEYTSLVKVHI